MDNFAKLPPSERKPYFELAAANSGLDESIIEKDFWACWTLKRLFTIPSLVNTFGLKLLRNYNVYRYTVQC